jgi:hypothetical protein
MRALRMTPLSPKRLVVESLNRPEVAKEIRGESYPDAPQSLVTSAHLARKLWLAWTAVANVFFPSSIPGKIDAMTLCEYVDSRGPAIPD